jgi:hypothetical protein
MESVQREARIVVPSGVPYLAKCWVRNKLLDYFGGYTSYPAACGGWRDGARDYEEEATVYDVAVPDRPESDWLLQEIVFGLFDRSAEQAVYVRHRDGTAVIVERPQGRPAHSDPVAA